MTNTDKQKEAQKKYYSKNKAAFAARQRNQRIRAQKTIATLKQPGCARCGYRTCLSALEFHHIDPKLKDAELRRAIRDKWPDKRIKAEIAKCVLLCSNCHREIHEELWDLDELSSQKQKGKKK